MRISIVCTADLVIFTPFEVTLIETTVYLLFSPKADLPRSSRYVFSEDGSLIIALNASAIEPSRFSLPIILRQKS